MCHDVRALSACQVESLLDEATAELGKMEFSPMLATIEIDFKITKAVPLHTTLRIDCEVCCRVHSCAACPLFWLAGCFHGLPALHESSMSPSARMQLAARPRDALVHNIQTGNACCSGAARAFCPWPGVLIKSMLCTHADERD